MPGVGARGHYLEWGARWLSGRASYSGARGRGVRNLPRPSCVLEQDTLLPEKYW